MSKRVIIIHGTEGSPDEGWFPWLRTQAESSNATVIVPSLPTPEDQSLGNWHREFTRQVGELRPDDILVGHSIGGSFALREVAGAPVPVTGLFIAAGVAQRIGHQIYDPLLASFVDQPFPWEQIKSRAKKIHVYHGEKDTLVPMSHCQEIADGLGIKLQVVPGAGHFSGDEAFLEFPQLWTDLTLLLDPDV